MQLKTSIQIATTISTKGQTLMIESPLRPQCGFLAMQLADAAMRISRNAVSRYRNADLSQGG
jgi:hypothetical protein